VFSVFTVSWENLTANKFEFMSQLRMPTNVVDNWPYYEFERYIKLLNEKNENEKKRQEESDKGQSNMPNMSGISNLAKNFNPSNYKLPEFKSPF
jgi:hypothetical protein